MENQTQNHSDLDGAGVEIDLEPKPYKFWLTHTAIFVLDFNRVVNIFCCVLVILVNLIYLTFSPIVIPLIAYLSMTSDSKRISQAKEFFEKYEEKTEKEDYHQ